MPFAKKAATKKAAKASKRVGAKRSSMGGDNFYGRLTTTKATPPTSKRQSAVLKRVQKKVTKYNDTYEKGLVFVAMSFKGDGGDDAFNAIKETCKSIKLNARRVDENYTSGFIILEIIELIEKAEFIIFDLTYERPNVYYELGYAHGVGNSPTNILLLAKEGTEISFDIAGLRVCYYKTTEHLRLVVRQVLSEMIKASRGL